MKTQHQTYIPPRIERMDVSPEQGFAASINTVIEPLTWDQEEQIGQQQ